MRNGCDTLDELDAKSIQSISQKANLVAWQEVDAAAVIAMTNRLRHLLRLEHRVRHPLSRLQTDEQCQNDSDPHAQNNADGKRRVLTA